MNAPNGRLRFGWLADQRLPWRELLAFGTAAEHLGYDGIWMSDHFFNEDGRWLLDAWTALGAILARVPRIEAGLLVASHALRPPLVTLHMAATLTDIGPRRFVLGLGAGGSREEHRVAGVAFPALADRVAELESTCALLRGAGTASAGFGRGRPAGHQAQSAPLLIGGASDPILRLAGRYADRWAVWGTPDEMAVLGSRLSRHGQAAGRDPSDIRRGAILMLIPDHLREVADPVAWPAEMRGDQTSVSRQLARYQEAGVRDVIVCDYGLDPADRMTALEWFAGVMAAY